MTEKDIKKSLSLKSHKNTGAKQSKTSAGSKNVTIQVRRKKIIKPGSMIKEDIASTGNEDLETKKEITKNIILGRLETSEDFQTKEKIIPPKESEIENLKITVRELNSEDIKNRSLPNQTTGLVITKIESDSPLLNYVTVNSIIIEAQKKKIKSIGDLNLVVKQTLKSNQKTILLVVYNNQNQIRYIGVKLD